jgi:predicted MFS family arabinose efflux permease
MIVAGQLAQTEGRWGIPATVLAIWALGLISLVAALPTHFPADARRPESPAAALRGFFRDAGRIVADRPALAALLGLAAFRGIVAVAVGALIAAVLARQDADNGASYRALMTVALLSMAGAALGSVLAGLQADRRRALGLVPIGTTGLALALAWVALMPTVPLVLCIAVGALGGMMNVPMIVAYQTAVPEDARGNGMTILNSAGYLSITAMSLTMAGLSAIRVLTATGQLVAVAGLAGLAAVAAWCLLHAQVRLLLRTLARR